MALKKIKEEDIKRNADGSRKKPKLKKIAEVLKMHFNIRNCNNMFWANIIEHIMSHNNNMILGKGLNFFFFFPPVCNKIKLFKIKNRRNM
jgi:hypothetical protein